MRKGLLPAKSTGYDRASAVPGHTSDLQTPFLSINMLKAVHAGHLCKKSPQRH